MIRLALYQPDIPQNTGAMLRLGACLTVPVDIVEPCGFPLSDKSLRRAGMDYLDQVDLTIHPGWEAFCSSLDDRSRRLILLTTKAQTSYTAFGFGSSDVILTGRESAGVPDEVHRRADHRVIIPLSPHARSLNVANAAAMVLGEALRQTKSFPRAQSDPISFSRPKG